MERVLRHAYPEVETFPLLRTLPAVAWELDVPVRVLVRSLKDPRRTLWRRNGKTYVPPDVYERWKEKIGRGEGHYSFVTRS
jgi:hypothetical protein